MSVLAAILRWAARLPVLRRLRELDLVDRVADAFDHGRIVRQSGRFMVRELSPRERTAAYRPRGSRLDVVVRHHTSDRYILDEVFRRRVYAVPDEPRERLLALARPRVVDIGAHVGLFGVSFLEQFPGAVIVAFEPDPGNAAVLRRCIERNGLEDHWTVLPVCAGTADGTTRFLAGRFAESHVGDDPDALELPVLDVYPYLADADVIKMDAEGAEWGILSDPRFARLQADVLALEYHPRGCPGTDPRSTLLALLADAGYEVREVDVPHAPPGVGMAMAWRS